MKKIVFAAAVLGGAISAPALATPIDTTTQFENRGQCQRAIVQHRNAVRQGGDSGFDNQQLNGQYATQVSCQQNSNGTYSIVVDGSQPGKHADK